MKTSETRAMGRALMLAAMLAGRAGGGVDWDMIQDVKQELLARAAQNAMAQQKTERAPDVPIALPAQPVRTGGVRVAARDGRWHVALDAAPQAGEPAQTLRFELPRPLNMVAAHSGLAMTVRAEDPTSPEVRWGVTLIGANGHRARIQPAVPIRSAWDDPAHEIYLDWAFIDYGNVEDAVAVLGEVVGLEFTAAAARRTPDRGASRAAQPARFELADLRLVDYLKGSYDPSRHGWRWDDGGAPKDLTLQHRSQEVTGIVARFGGDAGRRSAVRSLDMAARTQCWDGSFLDGRRGARTVVSGEYTHGFTLYGLLDGYLQLVASGDPVLDEPVRTGSGTMTRREAWERMFFRGAMSRASHPPTDYRDDIIGGDTLRTGANRVLGYAIAMHMIADTLRNEAQADTIRAPMEPILEQIAAAQGRYSGAFPILAEGNRYQGRGIHYDAGYIRTHMDWLVVGVRRTGHPLLLRMLDRYQAAFASAMDEQGLGLLRLLSERGGQDGAPVQLILPDATAQVGLEHGLPVIAQWGYNVGMPRWAQWTPGGRLNHFTFASHASGYALGAHTSILADDMVRDPMPRDLGYRFPRQFPIWSSRFYLKEDGTHVRTSRVAVHPDGRMVNDFRIEVGETLETVGVPVWIESPEGRVTVEAEALDGWPALLPDGAPIRIEDETGRAVEARIGEAVDWTLDAGRTLRISGPAVTLPPEMGGAEIPFRARLLLDPERPGLRVRLRVLNETPAYAHDPS